MHTYTVYAGVHVDVGPHAYEAHVHILYIVQKCATLCVKMAVKINVFEVID